MRLVSEINPSTVPKKAAVLLALTGLLGVVLLSMDQIIWQFMPSHAYALIIFVVIDFALAGLIVAKPSKLTFTLLVAWSVLRILLLVADVATNDNPASFANYLFNPTSHDAPNPAGIPGLFIDLMVILELIVIWISWTRRSAQRSA